MEGLVDDETDLCADRLTQLLVPFPIKVMELCLANDSGLL
jgi:hypothetical protein